MVQHEEAKVLAYRRRGLVLSALLAPFVVRTQKLLMPIKPLPTPAPQFKIITAIEYRERWEAILEEYRHAYPLMANYQRELLRVPVGPLNKTDSIWRNPHYRANHVP